MGGYQFCGLDCGKQSVHACPMNEKPENLKRFAETYRAKIYGSNLTDLQKLADLAQIYFIEPTGVYYRVFVEYLERAGKLVLLVPSRRVRSYCEHHGLFNKTDRIDPAGIVAYGIENIRDPRAFIQIHSQKLREVCGQMRTLQKQKQGVQSLLGQRLCMEVPEWVKVHEESDRDWLDPKPPALWRYISGEKVHNQKRRDGDLVSTTGQGLSDNSRRLARQLVSFEQWEYDLEQELAQILRSPEFEPYHDCFNRLLVPNKIRANLLTVIYPFERFLVDGKPEILTVIGTRSQRKSQLTKRNKSLDSFKIYNGLGTVLSESGTTRERVAGGSAFIRSQWWQLVKTTVVIRRPTSFEGYLGKLKQEHGHKQAWLNPMIVGTVAEKHDVSPQLAEAWVHYQELKITKPVDDLRICLVAGRMAKNLFRMLCDRCSN